MQCSVHAGWGRCVGGMLKLLACLRESAEHLAQGQRRVGHAPLGTLRSRCCKLSACSSRFGDESNNSP